MPYLLGNCEGLKPWPHSKLLISSHYFGLNKFITVKPPLTATSQQQPPLSNSHFFWRTVHTSTLVWTSLQRPLSSVPKVEERFNCTWQISLSTLMFSLKPLRVAIEATDLSLTSFWFLYEVFPVSALQFSFPLPVVHRPYHQ